MKPINSKFHSQIDIIKAFDNGELPKEIHVLPVGEWETGQYGKITITDEQAEEMVKNFNDTKRAGVPIDVDHDGGQAAGWVNDLIHKAGEGLFAIVEWTSKGKQLLEDKIYRFFSPEFSFDFQDPLTSQSFGPMFIAGTLTNRPLFRQLKSIVGSEVLTGSKKNANLDIVISANTNMNLEDILKKQPNQLTEEEKKFLTEHSSELSVEDRQKFNIADPEEGDEDDESDESSDDEDGKSKAEKEAAAKAEAEKKAQADKAEAEKAESDKVEGKEKSVTLSASELKRLQDDAKAGREAKQELIKASVEKDIDTNYMFNDSTGKGRFLPVGKTALVNLMLSFSETQKKLFEEAMAAIPDGKITLGEIGAEGGKSSLTAEEQLDKLIKDYIKANSTDEKKLTYAEAYEIVLKDKKNETLVKAREEEIKGK